MSARSTDGSAATIARVVALVQHVTGVDITVLSEISAGRYWFRGIESRSSIPISTGDSIPYEMSLCSRIHLDGSPSAVAETREDEPLWSNWEQLKTGLGVDWDVRAFATADVTLPDGTLWGTLCLHHKEPRSFVDDEVALIAMLARLVGDELGREQARIALEDAIAARIAAEDARAELVEELGHELRAPLQVIDGYTEAMIDGVLAADQAHLALVRREAGRSIRLLDDLAFLTRIESGPPRNVLELYDLATIARDIHERLEPLATAGGVTFDLRTQPSIARVDPDRLTQVLANLVRNALRAVDTDGSRIALEVEDDSTVARIIVLDDGPGIPEGELPHVFRRFYRGAVARDNSLGSGLGLTIARRIMEAHGGSIRAEPVAPRGTRFVIELPRAG